MGGGMLFSLVQADRNVRYAANQEKSGLSPFAPLKLRSLTVVPHRGTKAPKANNTMLI